MTAAQKLSPAKAVATNLPGATAGKTTPQQLRAALLSCYFFALLLAGAGFYAYSDLRQAVQTVGRDTVPSIVAAESIRATLADVDGSAASAFLSGEQGEGPYWARYRRQMDQVHDYLLTAIQNITYGDAERIPLLTISQKLAQYEALIGAARAHADGSAVPLINTADMLMQGTILPASLALDKANSSQLTDIYDAHKANAAWHAYAFLAAALIMLGLLIQTQFYLARRMKRLVNPALVLATLLTVGFALYGWNTLREAEATLLSAKQDAFDSVDFLSLARAVGFNANASSSLYLLAHGDATEQHIRANDFDNLASSLAAGNVDNDLNAADSHERFQGSLGDELHNITFDGEEHAAQATLRAWVDYEHAIDRMRALERQGEHDKAVAVYFEHDSQNQTSFDVFDTNLGHTLQINKDAFDSLTAKAFALLKPFPYALAIVPLLIALFSFIGLKPRLDEYRF